MEDNRHTKCRICNDHFELEETRDEHEKLVHIEPPTEEIIIEEKKDMSKELREKFEKYSKGNCKEFFKMILKEIEEIKKKINLS